MGHPETKGSRRGINESFRKVSSQCMDQHLDLSCVLQWPQYVRNGVGCVGGAPAADEVCGAKVLAWIPSVTQLIEVGAA